MSQHPAQETSTWKSRTPRRSRLVQIVHMRILTQHQQNQVHRHLSSYFVGHGLPPQTSLEQQHGGGSLFGVLVDSRIVGSIYIRVWPNAPTDGDIHIISSRWRMLDYATVNAFRNFLRSKEHLMNLTRWRVAIDPEQDTLQHALMILGFTDTGLHPFPLMGTARIMSRKVV